MIIITVILFFSPYHQAWVQNIAASVSSLKNKGSSVKTLCMPENVAAGREGTKGIYTTYRSTYQHCVSVRLPEANINIFTLHTFKIQILIHMHKTVRSSKTFYS